MSQDRLKFRVGDIVYVRSERGELVDPIHAPVMTVRRVEPALEAPYFCSDSEFHTEDDLMIWTPPQRTLQDFHAEVKRVAEHLRSQFNTRDMPWLKFSLDIEGNTTGDIKIKYTLDSSQYKSDRIVSGHDIEAVLDETFRREQWTKRNAPEQLTYVGTDEVDPF